MKSYHILFLLIFTSSCRDDSEINKLNTDIDYCKKELQLKNNELISKQAEIEALKAQLDLAIKQQENNNKKFSLSDLYLDVRQSVYLINTIDNDDNEYQGSAFCITRDGIAISNYHVFKNAAKVYAFNNRGDKYLVTEIIEKNEDLDYILFKLGPLSENIPHLKISNKKPIVGEDVFTVGNPKGLKQTLSNGIISAHRDQYLLQTTTSITHGSSGGPLLNKKGEVIGITTSGLGEANLNFAIDINKLNLNRHINTLYKNNNVQMTDNVLLNVMSDYYNLLTLKDFNKLNDLYTNTLSRYHSKYDIPKSVALKDHKNYFSVYTIQNVNIIPNSIIIYKSGLDYTLQYRLNYSIKNEKKNKELDFVLETVAVLNDKGKIKSIYDNILKKN